ncbi:MAG TPA: trypsin-like serine protease [Chromobacteriaceae bacterium]|nr:trypsin-like serine protease [Chromobacteriaceae bacterium]
MSHRALLSLGLALSLALSPLASAKESAREHKILFFGKDERVKTAPTHAPWTSVGQLETATGTICTGTLVADDVVLTAGHCFIDEKGHFDPATLFTVGLWGKQHRNQSKVTQVQVDRTFLKGLKHVNGSIIIPPRIAGRDVAFVRLSKPLGKQEGVVEVFAGNHPQLQQLMRSNQWKVTQGGYPIDDQTHLLVHSRCDATGFLPDGRLTHHCDTLAGDSGSPIFAQRDGKPVIVAIQSSAPDAKDRKRADNMALSAPVFYRQLQQFIHAR